MSARKRSIGAILIATLLALTSSLSWADEVPQDRWASWFHPPKMISSVELRLPHNVEKEGLADLVPLRVGQSLGKADLRKAVRILFETGRFRQVRAHVRDDEGAVAVTFVLLPKQEVVEVAFLGASAIDVATLKRVAGVRRGDDLSSGVLETMESSVVDAYERRGYRNAVVSSEIRESEDGRAALLVRIDEGAPTKLRAVRWVGDLGFPEELLAGVLALSPGDRLDLDAVEIALDRVRARFRNAGFLRARVGPAAIEKPGKEGEADILIPVSAGPFVLIRAAGNTRLGDSVIRDMMRPTSHSPLSSEEVARGVRRIERAYLLYGYYHARVIVEEVALTSRHHELLVTVDEGPPMRVRSIDFSGATGESEARAEHGEAKGERGPPARLLRRHVCAALEETVPSSGPQLDSSSASFLGGRNGYRVSSRPHPSQVPAPEPCEIYHEDAYRKAAVAIAEHYRQEGWLDARVAGPSLDISPDGRVARVSLRIEEGVRTRLRGVHFEGVETLDEGELRSIAGLRQGRPISKKAVREGGLAVRGSYAREGFAFARVEPRLEIDETRKWARVVYEVTEGPMVSVGRIIVRGHDRTPASLVRSQLTFGPGDTWEMGDVLASQRRILSLGIYRSATIRLLDPDQPAPVKDVVITVGERKAKGMEMGLGISTEDGPRVFAGYVDHDFLGNSELHGNVKVNYPIFPSGIELRRVLAPGMEWEARAGLRMPRLLGARTDIVGERANRPTYGLTRGAWSVGADSRWYEDLSASMGLEVEYVDFARAAPDPHLFHPDRERRRFEEGRTLLASLRPAVVLDLRDRRVSPRRGLLAGASLDWSHDLGVGVPVHFLKASASVSGYVPAPRRVTLAFTARGGAVLPLSEDNVTIEPKRFYLGGADTVRGFPLDGLIPEDQRVDLHRQMDACEDFVAGHACTEDALLVLMEGRRPASAGGEAFVLFKAELRFPVYGDLFGGLFLDAGNLWREAAAARPLDLRTAAGAGLRYETPVGPVAVDVGWNLMADERIHEMPTAVHFSIGLF